MQVIERYWLPRQRVRPYFASEPPNVVTAANCELWLLGDGSVEPRPHNAATGMRHVLNVTYVPGATRPEYDGAIKRIFEKAEYPYSLVNFFHELKGNSIQLRRDVALIVLMIDAGSNGKTSLVRLLTELVGTDFVHSGRVAEFDGERFQSATFSTNCSSSMMTFARGLNSPTGLLRRSARRSC